MNLLKVDKLVGKKGSKKPVKFTEKHRQAFSTIKQTLLSGLKLNTVNPDKS